MGNVGAYMADFCRHCSIALFGEDYRDLAELGPERDDDGPWYYFALCECCGPIQVDFYGARVTPLDDVEDAYVLTREQVKFCDAIQRPGTLPQGTQ